MVIVENLRELVDDLTVSQTNSHFILECPYCYKHGDIKYKLYIKKELDVGFCQVCKNSFVNKQKEGIYFQEIEKESPFVLCKVDCRTYLNCSDELVEFDYLVNRNPFIDFSKYVKSSLGKIIIPFYYKKELFTYQVRYTDPERKSKYFIPPMDNKGVYIPNYRGDVNKDFPTIIVEGVFDALAILSVFPEYNVVAVLGSYISKYQEWMLHSLGVIRGSGLILFLDKTELSTNLHEGVDLIIESSGEDPEEMLRRLGKDRFKDYIESYLNPFKRMFS